MSTHRHRDRSNRKQHPKVVNRIARHSVSIGDRIKIAGETHRNGYRLPFGTMGTVVAVGKWTAQVRFDMPPVELPLYLDTDPYWVQLDTCSGYFDVETARAQGFTV